MLENEFFITTAINTPFSFPHLKDRGPTMGLSGLFSKLIWSALG